MLRPTPAARPVVQGREANVLVTGFEPFGGSDRNPSWMAAQSLHGRVIEGHRVVATQIPTAFGRAIDEMAAALQRYKPVLVLGVGQAGGRTAISFERIAINVNDARIPDNAGAQPVDTPVVAGGPDAYFTSLPIKAMWKALLAEGINAEVSQTAGTFVCNHVFYGLMDLLTRPEHAGVRGGFVHVPWLPEQGQPSMRLAEQVEGLRLAIACALTTGRDVKAQAGALN